MANFFKRLEKSVEPAMKIIVNVIIIVGFIAGECFLANEAAPVRTSYYEHGFLWFPFLIASILNIVACYIVWVIIMFSVNTGININKIRQLLESQNPNFDYHNLDETDDEE